jgi:hypothetical protein
MVLKPYILSLKGWNMSTDILDHTFDPNSEIPRLSVVEDPMQLFKGF